MPRKYPIPLTLNNAQERIDRLTSSLCMSTQIIGLLLVDPLKQQKIDKARDALMRAQSSAASQKG